MSIYVRIRDGMREAEEDDIRGPITDFLDLSGGVADKSGGDLLVEAQSSPDLSVQVSKGVCYVPNTSFTRNTDSEIALYDVLVDAAISSLSISSNASGSTRIDLVCVYVNESTTPDTNASNVASVLVVEGTAGAGVPATPSNHYVLAQITVSNGAVSITSSDIVDTREQAKWRGETTNNVGGWQSLTYVIPTHSNGSQADDPTYEITFAGVDLTSELSAGMKVKIVQSTTKYFVITKVALDGSDTDVTLYGGTDYDLVDTGTTAITSFEYSTSKSPVGFPLNIKKWTIEVTDITDRSASSTATWANLASISIDIHIGVWQVSYEAIGRAEATAATETPNLRVTLSTGTTTESNPEFTDSIYTKVESTNIAAVIEARVGRSNPLVLTAKATYYLNVESTVASGNVRLYNSSGAPLVIRAVCAYL